MGCSFGGFNVGLGANLFVAGAIERESMSMLYAPQFNWDYQKRNHQTNRDQYGHVPLWRRSQFISGGDPTVAVLGLDAGNSGLIEISPYGETSVYRPWFIRGRCLDQSSAPVAGAIVQGFLTSNDLFVAETVADDSGYYQLGTPYFGLNHFLVAYKPGSPDIAGTTVNTLQPAL